MGHTPRTSTEERLTDLALTAFRPGGLPARSDDHLFRVAGSLVRLSCGTPAPRRNASLSSTPGTVSR